MLRSINIAKVANVVNFALAVIGLLYVVYALYCVWVGIGQVEPFRNFQHVFLSTVVAGVTLGSAKGADKVKKQGPFTISEAETKKGKSALVINFQNDEKGKQAMEHIGDLSLLSGVAFFSWPSKNTDKDNCITKGMLNNAASLHILENYEKMNFKNAKELKAENQEAKAKSREAKKTAKSADKNGASVILAKIQAYKDLHAEGLITVEVMMSKIEALS